MKLPTKSQWWQFLKDPRRFLSKGEKIFFFLFFFLGLGSLFFISANFYLKNTEIKPARGGIYVEGLIGSPRRINPIYAQENDVDRDLTELIFSSLIKHNEKGELIPDLAKEYKIIEEGKVFEFYLKENLLWSDGAPLTADDIIFTVKIIQEPSSKSSLRASWLGVKTEKISDLGVRFELKSPSAVFLENCTLKIIPKHVWEEISEQNLSLSIHNLKPIGSGPYKVKQISQDKEGNIKSLELETSSNYYGKLPHIPRIIFYFFSSKDQLIASFDSNQVKGLSLVLPEKYQDLNKKEKFSDHRLLMPRYFAVFFNPEESKILEDKKIRQALSYAIDKENLIDKVLSGQGKITDSPILPDIYGFEGPFKAYQFNPEKADQLLKEAGFFKKESGFREKVTKKEPSFQFKSNLEVGSKGVAVEELQKCLANPPAGGPDIYPEGEITGHFGEKTKEAVIRFQEKYKEEILMPHSLTKGSGKVLSSTRDKLNQLCAPVLEQSDSLSLSLTVLDQPTLNEAALYLKESWEKLGIKIEIKNLDSPTFVKEKIRTRDYQMLLFGQMLELTPDPFPFWHSSQTKDPGLNLALYENKEADKLLEQARQTFDKNERKELLEKFQNIIMEDAPAIFLYSPDYVFWTSEEIKGISDKIVADPSKRFSDIENWYIKTKRAWK